jgi:hypothetical protein
LGLLSQVCGNLNGQEGKQTASMLTNTVTTVKPHFWSELILRHVFIATILENMRRYPILVALGRYILPWMTTSVIDKHSGYTREKVRIRLEQPSDRKDFLSNVISKVHSGEVSHGELVEHASTLVYALHFFHSITLLISVC